MAYPKEFAKHFIGVGGLVFHNDQVLLVQPKYGKSKGMWMIPGGFLNQGETLIEAVKREIFEETGMEVEPEGLISVRTMIRNTDGITDLYSIIKCKLISSPQNLQAQQSEVEKVAWIPIESCFNNESVSPYTKLIIKRSLNLIPLKLQPPISEQRKRRFDISKYEEFWVDN